MPRFRSTSAGKKKKPARKSTTVRGGDLPGRGSSKATSKPYRKAVGRQVVGASSKKRHATRKRPKR